MRCPGLLSGASSSRGLQSSLLPSSGKTGVETVSWGGSLGSWTGGGPGLSLQAVLCPAFPNHCLDTQATTTGRGLGVEGGGQLEMRGFRALLGPSWICPTLLWSEVNMEQMGRAVGWERIPSRFWAGCASIYNWNRRLWKLRSRCSGFSGSTRPGAGI